MTLRNQISASVEPTTYETNVDKTHHNNHFTYSLCVIPHPSKRDKGGEDAYYVNEKFYNISKFMRINFIIILSILAVADGVGGWNEAGIDPAKYSKELCQQFVFYIYNIYV